MQSLDRLTPWDLEEAVRKVQTDGCCLTAWTDTPQVLAAARRLEDSLLRLDADGKQVLHDHGRVYGARNLLDWFPNPLEPLEGGPLGELLRRLLGPQPSLVRMLFFDKPPASSWSLPWHRDLTIAVREPLPDPLTPYGKPTRKAGVRHVEADRGLLAEMLTVRLHLDACDAENGALQVLPGSHRESDTSQGEPRRVEARAGDILLMRPLLVHGSGQGGSQRHRRILHYEFAPLRRLAPGYAWRWALPLGSS